MTMKTLVAQIAVSAAILCIDKLYSYKVPDIYAEKAIVGQRVLVPFGRGNKKTEGFILSLKYCFPDECAELKSIFMLFDDIISLSDEDIAVAGFIKNHYYCTFFEAANAMLPPGVWSNKADLFQKSDLSLDEIRNTLKGHPAKLAVAEAVYLSDKAMSVSEIINASGINNAEDHLKELVKAGFLQLKQSFSKTTSDKFILFASPLISYKEAEKLFPAGKLGDRRKEVYKRLCDEGELPVKELCYLTGSSASLISTLQKTGFISVRKEEEFRRPEIKTGCLPKKTELNNEQKKAFDSISALMTGKPAAALLYGVTGSGKTEIYIELIRKVIRSNKTAILMVPEIALTPQTVRRFYSYFNDDVAIIHSALTASQRYDEYKRIKTGQAHIVIGTRTAVFAPLKNLGIIVIDEEQEYTYKSENTPRYNAEEVAKFRAIKHNCLVLMGSATPSVVTRYSAESGKISLVRLDKRFNDVPLPKTVISDMRGKLKGGDAACVGPELAAEIRTNLDRKEKTILFLNRRGSAHKVICIDCGFSPKCLNCSVPLVYHSKNKRIVCHYCGYSEPIFDKCPECGSSHLKFEGTGTQRLEEELKALFPSAKIIRMDTDTVSGRTTHEKILDEFCYGGGDILIGTQMVAKGLDFDDVTLVGVVDSDGFLSSGDFRAQERAFSLITQVVGRAGRRNKQGRAVIQTYSPENPVILSAAKQDYDSFYEYEIRSRQALDAPPFSDIMTFMLSGKSEEKTLKAALSLSATLRMTFKESGLDTVVLGPAAAPISKLNNKYRFNVSFRCRNDLKTRYLVNRILTSFSGSRFSRDVSAAADINIYN